MEAVQRRSTLGSSEEAERSIQETLEVLAEHLGDDKAKVLAAKLLSEIAQYLPHERGQAGKAFMLSEFIDQVYQRGDALHPEEATVRARTVLQTIEEAVTEGGIRRSRLTTAAGVRPATRRGGASGVAWVHHNTAEIFIR